MTEQEKQQELERIERVKNLTGSLNILCTDPDTKKFEGELLVPRNTVSLCKVIWETTAESSSNVFPDVVEDEVEDLPLQVSLQNMRLIVEFCENFLNKSFENPPKPLTSDKLGDFVPEWAEKFVDKDQATLFQLILASNMLDLGPLLYLGCAKVATMIKGKTPEEIRETFGIKDDLTDKEKEAIKKENSWIEGDSETV